MPEAQGRTIHWPQSALASGEPRQDVSTNPPSTPIFIKILNNGPCHSLNTYLLGVCYVLGTLLYRNSITLKLSSD